MSRDFRLSVIQLRHVEYKIVTLDEIASPDASIELGEVKQIFIKYFVFIPGTAVPVQDEESPDYQNDEDYISEYPEDDDLQTEDRKGLYGSTSPVYFEESETTKTVHEGQHAVLQCDAKNVNRK